MPAKQQDQSAPVAYSYIRFSSVEQRKGDSIRRQTEARDRFIRERGLILDTKLKLKDEGVSGFRGKHRSDKHALGQFLKLVDAGRIVPGSYLIVENLDRLSREDVEEGLYLLLGLMRKGIVVVQVTPVITEFRKGESDNSAKLMMAVMELSRGNSESVRKSELIGGAWENKRRQARKNGVAISKSCPHWLRRAGEKYELIPDRADAVRLMFQLSAEGFGINGVIRRLVVAGHKPFGRAKHWTNTYIGRILKGRTAVGEYQPYKGGEPEGEPIKGFYPAVVSEEVWWKVQHGLQQRLNHKGGRSRHDVNLFAGLMRHALDGDKIEYKMFKDVQKSGTYHHPRYVNSLSLVAQAKLSSFPVLAFEQGVLECLAEIDPMDVLPGHDAAEDDVMTLRAEYESCETQLKNIEDKIVKGESLKVWEKAAARLEAKKEELGKLIAAASMRASNPQSESWGTCHTLITALASCEDREAARLRLQSALRNVVKKLVCLFIKNGRRQIACVQFHFEGSDQIRTVFVRHRGELTNIKAKTPEHVSWSTRLDGIPEGANIEDAKTRAVVAAVMSEMCKEGNWLKAFEPDRPTGAEKIRQRKLAYMKTYRKGKAP